MPGFLINMHSARNNFVHFSEGEATGRVLYCPKKIMVVVKPGGNKYKNKSGVYLLSKF